MAIEIVADFLFLGSKITVNNDCSHEIKRLLFLGRKAMTHLLLLLLSRFSRVRLSATPWTSARQTSLSFTVSRSWLKLTSIESVMPSNHLILCRPLLLLLSIFPSIRGLDIYAEMCPRSPLAPGGGLAPKLRPTL